MRKRLDAAENPDASPEALLKRYEDGLTVREVAEETGLSYNMTNRRLRTAGASFRKPGPRKRSMRKKPEGVGVHPSVVDSTVIDRAIGQELQLVRTARAWTRKDLADTAADVSVQALHNYEHGIRPLNVRRFVDLCRALGTTPSVLLGVALQRAGLERGRDGVRVGLHKVLKGNEADLRPLRRWARKRLVEYPDGIVHLNREALEDMAALLGFGADEFTDRLVEFTPDVVPWMT